MQYDDNAYISYSSPAQPPNTDTPPSKPNSRSSSVFESYDPTADAKRRRLLASLQQSPVSSSYESPSTSPYTFHNTQTQHSNASSSFDYSVLTSSLPRSHSMTAMSQDQKIPTHSMTTLTLGDDAAQPANQQEAFQPNAVAFQSNMTAFQPITTAVMEHQANKDETTQQQATKIESFQPLIHKEAFQANTSSFQPITTTATTEHQSIKDEATQQQTINMASFQPFMNKEGFQPTSHHIDLTQQTIKDERRSVKMESHPPTQYNAATSLEHRSVNDEKSRINEQYLLHQQNLEYKRALESQQQNEMRSMMSDFQQRQNQLRYHQNQIALSKAVYPPQEQFYQRYQGGFQLLQQYQQQKEPMDKTSSEKEVIVIEDDEIRNVCIGMVQTDIVTIKQIDFGGVKHDNLERVRVQSEGKRGQANYSFVVTTAELPRRFYGWVPFEETKVLGPLVDYRLIWWDALIPHGKVNHARTPLYMILYCHHTQVTKIEKYFKEKRFYLKDPPFCQPGTQYQNVNHFLQSSTFRYDRAYMNYRNSNETEGGARFQKDLQKLLDSIPSDVPKKKKKNKETEDGKIILDSDDDDEEDEEEAMYIDGLKLDLMPHQVKGVGWMMDREGQNSAGGILADMGLGKTIQTIALVASTMTSGEKMVKEGEDMEISESADDHKVTLIVTPLSLIRQWEDEFRTKTNEGKLKVMVHHGGNRTKDPSVFADYDVIITTYQVVSSDFPNPEKKKRSKNENGADTPDSDAAGAVFSPSSNNENGSLQLSVLNPKSNNARDNNTPGPLFQFNWYRVVLDEAQQIKNRNTRTSLSCSALTAVKRWCLTGTPIQNNIEDLFSLLRFLKIEPLNNYSKFRETIITPIQNNKANIAMSRLKVILSGIMLRRTKDVLKHQGDDDTDKNEETSDDSIKREGMETSSSTENLSESPADAEEKTVLSKKIALKLPARQKQDILLDFSPHERALYNILNLKGKEAVKKTLFGGKKKQSNYINMLCIILRLRQACDHPQLILDSMDKENDLLDTISMNNGNELNIQTCELCERQMSQYKGPFCQPCRSQIDIISKNSNNEAFQSSTKIQKLIEILKTTQEQNPGEKTIVFSQFTSMLNLMEKHLNAAGIKFCRYDGSMSSQARESSLKALRYDAEYTVMLISLKCGSLGLNLTAANRVILMDIWWNPAVEEQAIDRVHRIGQHLPVYVTRLMIHDTIEQKVNKLQEKKARLIQGAMGDGVINSSTKLTNQEIRELFSM